MLALMANSTDTGRTAPPYGAVWSGSVLFVHEQSDLGLYCLSKPFDQVTHIHILEDLCKI